MDSWSHGDFSLQQFTNFYCLKDYIEWVYREPGTIIHASITGNHVLMIDQNVNRAVVR